MGSFSWLSAPKSKNEKKVKNIWCVDYDNESWGVSKEKSDNAAFIMYIPQELGGGFIFDKSYQDYGKINNFDIYTLFGLMNTNPDKFKEILTTYRETGEVDEEFQKNNRDVGIDLDFTLNLNQFIWEIERKKELLKNFDKIKDEDFISKYVPSFGFSFYKYEIQELLEIKEEELYEFQKDKLETALQMEIHLDEKFLQNKKNKLKYPLKLRQVNSKTIDYSIEDFNLSYEDIEGYSANDPNQGFGAYEYDLEINSYGLINTTKEYDLDDDELN